MNQIETHIKCSDKSMEEYLNYVIQTLTPILRKVVKHNILWERGEKGILFHTNNILWVSDTNYIYMEIQKSKLNNWVFRTKYISDKSYYCFYNDELDNDVKKYNRSMYLKELI